MNQKKNSEGKTAEKVAKSPYEEYTEMQVKAVFEVFDEDQNGRAKLKHLGTILRALGRVISNADVRTISEKLEDPEYPKYMLLETLLPVATKLLLHDNYKSASFNSLMQEFRKLDRKNEGCIDKDYFKRLFREHGVNVEDEVFEKFIIDSSEEVSGKIKYKDICGKLTVPQYFDISDNRRKIRLEISRESSRAT